MGVVLGNQSVLGPGPNPCFTLGGTPPPFWGLVQGKTKGTSTLTHGYVFCSKYLNGHQRKTEIDFLGVPQENNLQFLVPNPFKASHILGAPFPFFLFFFVGGGGGKTKEHPIFGFNGKAGCVLKPTPTNSRELRNPHMASGAAGRLLGAAGGVWPPGREAVGAWLGLLWKVGRVIFLSAGATKGKGKRRTATFGGIPSKPSTHPTLAKRKPDLGVLNRQPVLVLEDFEVLGRRWGESKESVKWEVPC